MKFLFTALAVFGTYANFAVAEGPYVEASNQISKSSSVDLEGYTYSTATLRHYQDFIRFYTEGRVIVSIGPRDLPLYGRYLVNGLGVTITLHSQVLTLNASEDGCSLADQNGLQFFKDVTECHP